MIQRLGQAANGGCSTWSGTVEQWEGTECSRNASGDMFDIIAFQHRILMYYCYQYCSQCRSGGILDERFADVEVSVRPRSSEEGDSVLFCTFTLWEKGTED